MCALYPPPWQLPTFGWPLDDHIGHEQINYNPLDHSLEDPFMNYNVEIDSSRSIFEISTPQPAGENDSPKVSPSSCKDVSSNLKKMSHNANERDRRKKLNSFYSSLRSLLPVADQKKKFSIPATISLVLKYIPELKTQVERLMTRKEEIISQISKQSDLENLIKGRREVHYPLGSSTFPAISTTHVDEREVVVQICTSDTKSTPLSEIVMRLEEEGFQLLNASSFTGVKEKVFHTLHLQVKGFVRIECELLIEKLNSFYMNKEELHVFYSDFKWS